MGPFIQKIFTSVVLNWQALLPTRTSLISRGAKDVMRHAIWDLWSINLPMNTLVFTSYLKSGVWIEKVWIGGVVEKRLRTTVSYQILRQTLRLEHSHVTKLTMSYTPAYSKSIGNTIVIPSLSSHKHYLWKHQMLLRQICWWTGAPWSFLY